MEIRFWGVRGSIASSGTHSSRIGGNTSCVEVVCGQERLILDAGTGIRALGDELLRQGTPVRATLLFSHLHWDHLQGFPFFTPAYVPSSELTLLGPGHHGAEALRNALATQMSPPGFPVTLEAMRARLVFAEAVAGRELRIGPFTVTPLALPHPNGCLGYRISADGRSFVYATDVELSADTMTPETLSGLSDADLLCLDAQYTPEEYEGKRGWGHSTMVEAARVAARARAGRLLLFHHDPAHSDDVVEEMAESARRHFPNAEPAREGKRIVLEARTARVA